MKCPKCGKRHPSNEKKPCSCGWRFIFTPSDDAGLTDEIFNAAIKEASKNRAFYFSKNQLYAVFYRKFSHWFRTKKRIYSVLSIVFGLFFLLPLAGGLDLSALSAGIPLAFTLYKRFFKYNRLDFSRDEFTGLLERWIAHQPEEKLLAAARLHLQPKEWVRENIFHFRAEKILIVDKDLLVYLLVMNGFHAREKALIVSIHGYPGFMVPRLRGILDARPDVPVFYLHGTLPEEESTYGKYEAQELIQGREIIDLGFFSKDLKNKSGLRDLPANEWGNWVPADGLTFGSLAVMLSAAMSQGVPLSEVKDADSYPPYKPSPEIAGGIIEYFDDGIISSLLDE